MPRARDPSQFQAGAGGLQACFPSPPPLLGSQGWAHQSDLTRTFKASYLKCTAIGCTHRFKLPSPYLGEGAAPFQCTVTRNFLAGFLIAAGGFWPLVATGPQAGHKLHDTCTSWYAYAAMFSSSNDIHDRPFLPAFTVTLVLASSLFCEHKSVCILQYRKPPLSLLVIS